MENTPRKFSDVYCPHCKKEVSKSTWYVHYNNFYDKKTNSWQSGTDLASKVADFDFDSMELEEFGDAKGNTDTSCEMIQDEYFDDHEDEMMFDSDTHYDHDILATSVSSLISLNNLCLIVCNILLKMVIFVFVSIELGK